MDQRGGPRGGQYGAGKGGSRSWQHGDKKRGSSYGARNNRDHQQVRHGGDVKGQTYKGNKTQSNKGSNKENTQPIVLPYDFVPFAPGQAYVYPYTEQTLPKHDELHDNDRLSGSIAYTITAQSDLVMELRQGMHETAFVSGSQLRGKIRTNVEMLSNSYPEFVDRTTMLYRDVTSKNGYYKLQMTEDASLEKKVRAGFLRKIDGNYYIFPAKRLGNKHFLSVKEHWLKNLGVLRDQECLFRWGYRNTVWLNKLNECHNEINGLTEQIHILRSRLKLNQKLNDDLSTLITKVFTEDFNFNQSSYKRGKDALIKEKTMPVEQGIQKLLEIESENLKGKLKQAIGELLVEPDFCTLINKYAERWKLKAHIDLIYALYLSRQANRAFKPYEKGVFFRRSAGGSLEKISLSSSKDERGYLFNSTSAASKRSHYLIAEQEDDPQIIKLSSSTILAYNQAHAKMRFNLKKSDGLSESEQKKAQEDYQNKMLIFYDLFNVTGQHEEAPQGDIVFFVYDQDSDKLEIGRTPYFKIAYPTQLADLLGSDEPDKVDYAKALFGYVNEAGRAASVESAERDFIEGREGGYKSRLRFGPLDVQIVSFANEVQGLQAGALQTTEKSFLLPSPSASAEGMYLEQQHGKQRNSYTYERTMDSKTQTKPVLRGNKYYHVVEQAATTSAQLTSMETKRMVVDRKQSAGTFRLSGKIWFSGITQAELGLLLLALDLKQLSQSVQFGATIAKSDFPQLNAIYELIGGAKPYGYGKVQIDVAEVRLETKSGDFSALIDTPDEAIHELSPYIDAFLAKMGGDDYLNKRALKAYIQSKQVFNNPAGFKSYPDWVQMSTQPKEDSKQVGYGKGQYLKSLE